MGTYGRFNAHNARVKQLKYDKRKRHKNIRAAIRESGSIKNDFKKVDNQTLEKIKLEIREKANAKKKLKNILSVVFIIVLLCSVVFFMNWITNL